MMNFAGWTQAEAKERFCEWCGEIQMCDHWIAGIPEPETGYLDETWLCRECSQSEITPEATWLDKVKSWCRKR